MDQIAASDAKARFSELLDKVEKGQTVIITRHGRAIARLVPDEDKRQKDVDDAIARIRARQKRAPKITLKELLSSIHEGHKY
jgi:prevent-host-death family protein